MKRILIARGVRPLRNGKVSAKLYPEELWTQLIHLLVSDGYEIQEITEMPLEDLERTIKESLTVVCCDSFISHFCWMIGKKAVVIFGKSDPTVFGHKENINLLKDRRNLRPDPFRWWEDVEPSNSVWVSPKEVLEAVRSFK